MVTSLLRTQRIGAITLKIFSRV